MTILEMHKTSVLDKLIQIYEKFFSISSERFVNTRLDNEILADKDQVDKDEAESHIIVGLVTLVL